MCVDPTLRSLAFSVFAVASSVARCTIEIVLGIPCALLRHERTIGLAPHLANREGPVVACTRLVAARNRAHVALALRVAARTLTTSARQARTIVTTTVSIFFIGILWASARIASAFLFNVTLPGAGAADVVRCSELA